MKNREDKETRQAFWEQGPPMGFIGESYSYAEKRDFRYSLQDYMHDTFHFDQFRGQKLLEIGCGAGIDSAEFARNGALVTSVDFSRTAVAQTKALFEEANLEGEAYQADATALQFEDNTFDCVYSFGVLHHVPDIEKTLSEIQRVLKPGGKLMVMLYNRDSLLYGFSIVYLRGIQENKLKDLSMDELLARYSERKEDNPYTRVFDKTEATELFSKYFRNCATEVRYNVIDLPAERKVKLEISDEYELGWHLIVKAEK